MRWLVIIYLLLFASKVQAARGEWQMMRGELLSYRLLLPEQYDDKKSYPLLLFLHGQGGEVGASVATPEIADTYFNSDGFRARFPAIVIAPQCEGSNNTWLCSWGGTQAYARIGEIAAVQIVGAVSRDFAVDRSRIYITGISLGANGVWDMIWRYPSLFAAALPVAGATWRWHSAHAELLLDFPIWAAHGRLDPEVPSSYDESNDLAIHYLGGQKMRLTEYPGAEHDVWSLVYRDEAYFRWLFAQRKDPSKN